MGNYSVLWIAKDKGNYSKETDEYLEVKYAIPLFWIALFTQDDIHKTHYDDGEPYFFFETTIPQAIVNFQKRIHLWTTLYNNEKAGVLAEVFLKYLEQYPNHYVIFNVDDVLSMYLLFDNEADKAEMIDMVQTIDQLTANPKSEISHREWLPESFEFSSMKTRYFDLDGMGEDLLPCPEVDEWLNQNALKIEAIKQKESTTQIKITNLTNTRQKTETINTDISKKSKNNFPKGMIYLYIALAIILTLYFLYSRSIS